MPRPDIMRPIKPAEEIKNGSITVATSEASFQNVDPDINQHVASGDIVSGNTDRFDNINYYAQDGKLIPIVGQTPAAAYSLRALSGKTNASVVRLRRLSGSAEKDFAANELIGSSEGAEVVTNGGFDTDSDWTKGGGWSITGGQAVYDGSYPGYSWLAQDGIISTEAGRYYKITFTVVAGSGPPLGGGLLLDGKLRSFQSMGIYYPGRTYSLVFRTNGPTPTSPSKGWFRFAAYRSNTITVDNVSCVEYTPTIAEIWSLNAIEQNGAVSLEDEKAFITTWYDQSGNGNHATQATAARQPLLILGGVTQLENGKPALSFDGVDDTLELGSTALSTARHDSFMVMQTSDGTHVMTSQDSSSAVYGWVAQAGSSNTTIHSSFGSPTLYTNGTEPAQANRGDISNALSTGSQVLQSTIDADTSAWTDFLLCGFGLGGSFNFVGNIQELVVYTSDQSANRTNIEKNINNYYNIYGDFLDVYGGANAAYSLRDLKDRGTSNQVVRLRRDSDSAESDFAAADLVGSVEGAELVTNGGFDTDSDWAKDPSWSITGGQAVCDGTQVTAERIDQPGILPFGEVCKVTFTVVSCPDFTNMKIRFGGPPTLFTGLGIDSVGTHTLLTNASNGNFYVEAPSGATITIDDISAVNYTPTAAEQWALTEGFPGYSPIGPASAKGKAYVTTWYDQSGNGKDALQATSNLQPQLIRAGVTITDNGSPAVYFDNPNKLVATDFGISDYPFTRLSVNNHATNKYSASLSDPDGSHFIGVQATTPTFSRYIWLDPDNGNSHIQFPATRPAQILTYTMSSSSGNHMAATDDDGLTTSQAYKLFPSGIDRLNIGGGNVGSDYMNGYVQEVIYYNTDESSSRNGMIKNINNHYNIY